MGDVDTNAFFKKKCLALGKEGCGMSNCCAVIIEEMLGEYRGDSNEK